MNPSTPVYLTASGTSLTLPERATLPEGTSLSTRTGIKDFEAVLYSGPLSAMDKLRAQLKALGWREASVHSDERNAEAWVTARMKLSRGRPAHFEGQVTSEYMGMKFEEPMTMVRQDSLELGDIVFSSYHGRMAIHETKTIAVTTYLRGPGARQTQAGESSGLIPLIRRAADNRVLAGAVAL